VADASNDASRSRDVPVALFLFNRADTLRRVVDVLARVQPRRVFLIADGPRPGYPSDVANCRAARAVVERLDWRCEVVRNFAETNLGCDPRIASGLDWVFDQVDEAILLEDDIVPDPSFFAWCAAMLDRYRHEPQVMHVAGRNHLGRWIEPGVSHYLLRRGSVWGWATWRLAWQAGAPAPLRSSEEIGRRDIDQGVDSLVLDHFRMFQEEARSDRPGSWDTSWELRKALLGGLSVVPPVNLVRHIGFGANATHSTFAGDLRGLTPVGTAPDLSVANCVERDDRLDRWSLLLELMATCREPQMAWRVARVARRQPVAGRFADLRLRQQLAPFTRPAEAVAVLEHFRAAGATSPLLDELLGVLACAAAEAAAAAS
jgi:hypothetical protein